MDKQMIRYNKFGWVDLSKLARNKNGTIDWKSSIGRKIHFRYQDVESDIILLEYLYEDKIRASIPNYRDEYIFYTDIIMRGCLGKAVKKITSEFIYKVGDVVNGCLLLTSTYMDKGQKYYTYTCQIDGYNGYISEGNITKGVGCSVCANLVIVKGINDIATVRPDMVSLFWNPEDAYIYGPYSKKKVDFKCPYCGNKVNTQIYNVTSRGLSCRKCGDNHSYPEKFVFNFLQQVGNIHQENIGLQNFKPQKTFEWSKNISHQNPKLSGDKKYDFYIPLNNELIIETHGEQHFEKSFNTINKNARTLEEEQENDRIKKDLAILNGITPECYVQLDCRYSNINHIKRSIMSSALPVLLDFSENQIDWNECGRFASSGRVYEACDLWNSGNHRVGKIAEQMKVERHTIHRYLCMGLELGILQNPSNRLLNSKQNKIIINY